jgi:peptidoglycan/xylan/chitin deacetylase (PgdA/CDA1 family)
MSRRSAILTYHSLDDSGSVISTPPSVFRRQLEFLAVSGIPVVPLDQAVERPGCVALTFDDGFRSVAEHALPLLEQYHFAATIFIVSGYCGGRNDWPSQPSGIVPTLPLLSWDELGKMPSSIAIGAHTHTHPDLRRLPEDECDHELRTSKDCIEQNLGRAVSWLAYPYGASSSKVRSLAARHFDLAVGDSLGRLSPRHERLNLPRIDTYYLRDTLPLERLFTPAGNAYVAIRAILRGARRLASR